MADSNAARRFTDSGSEGTTVIGKGTRIQGEIVGDAPIEVWGSVEGKAGTGGLFWVREGGEVGGEVAAANVVVEGKVKGSITAKEKTELRSTCEVRGDITSHAVAIAEGSFFEGRVHMAGEGGQRRFQEKRKP